MTGILTTPQLILRSWLRPPLCCLRQASSTSSTSTGPGTRAKFQPPPETPEVTAAGRSFQRDGWTNVTPKILSYLGRDLHRSKDHPISLVKQRITSHFNGWFQTNRGYPVFSVHEGLSPIVTVQQNYDTLLVPQDHPSRKKSDAYYFNRDHMLRAHTSAHQTELIGMGFNNFLVVGDCYRRDEIDARHYPVFHQMEGVRLLDVHELQKLWNDRLANPQSSNFDGGLFVSDVRTEDKQETHNMDAVKYLEIELKDVLVSLAKSIFGEDVQHRWVEAYFPFTHPSWELEVFTGGRWLELLGCGIIEQKILSDAGVHDRVGWAFGIGLERVAMRMYRIPDIRLFWSKDTGFTSQFEGKDPFATIEYKAVSKFPQCTNDISFWLPQSETSDGEYSSNDFYDLVRSIGGDLVEQVGLVDEFVHKKKQRTSHCYRIVYRSPERTLTQEEVNQIHADIETQAVSQLGVEIR